MSKIDLNKVIMNLSATESRDLLFRIFHFRFLRSFFEILRVGIVKSVKMSAREKDSGFDYTSDATVSPPPR